MCDFGIRCFFEYKMNDGDFDYEESSIIIIANLSFNKFKLVQVLYKIPANAQSLSDLIPNLSSLLFILDNSLQGKVFRPYKTLPKEASEQ